MPKRKEPELIPEEQFKRFVKTAKEHEVDVTGRVFEEAFERIAESKNTTNVEKKTKKSSRK